MNEITFKRKFVHERLNSDKNTILVTPSKPQVLYYE